MRNFFAGLLIIFMAITCNTFAQTNSSKARAILDKTANKIGRAGGISAPFTMSSPNSGAVSGHIAVKGNKFNARTPQATVWFNGKTQWTYMKKSDEVNVSTPTLAQQQMMNPYTFLNLYKKGYDLTTKTVGSNNEVHLIARNKRQSIQEMYITISKSYTPSKIRMKHGGKWYYITIGAISSKNLPNSMFSFNSKEYPTAEIIDLR